MNTRELLPPSYREEATASSNRDDCRWHRPRRKRKERNLGVFGEQRELSVSVRRTTEGGVHILTTDYEKLAFSRNQD